MFSFFIFKNKERLVFTIFFVVSILFMSFSTTKFSISLKAVFNTVVYPFEYAVIGIKNTVVYLVSSFTEVDSLRKELKEKDKLIEYYRGQLADYYSIKYKIKELEEVLKYKSESSYKLEISKILNRDTEEIFSHLIIDKGYVDGIRVGMPVISYNRNEPGIVGIVSEVYLLTSKVRTYKDPLFSTGVYLPYSKVIAVASGMGKDKTLLSLGYIEKDINININEPVLTTSESSIFPENIKVGYVNYIDNTEKSSLTYKVFLKPHIDINSIKNVFIITERR